MPILRSPNGAHLPHPQAGRDRPEWVVAINRKQSIEIAGRDHPVCALLRPLHRLIIPPAAERFGICSRFVNTRSRVM
jgi:hypothetical protein